MTNNASPCGILKLTQPLKRTPFANRSPSTRICTSFSISMFENIFQHFYISIFANRYPWICISFHKWKDKEKRKQISTYIKKKQDIPEHVFALLSLFLYLRIYFFISEFYISLFANRSPSTRISTSFHKKKKENRYQKEKRKQISLNMHLHFFSQKKKTDIEKKKKQDIAEHFFSQIWKQKENINHRRKSILFRPCLNDK